MYDEVTFLFIFRSVDGKVNKIEEANNILQAFAVADKVSSYREKGLFLSNVFGSLNRPVPGASAERAIGNA